MQALDHLFGLVFPAGLNATTQAVLVSSDGSQSIPAVITLRIEEEINELVADYLCLVTQDTKPVDTSRVFYDAFWDNQLIEIRPGFEGGSPGAQSHVLSYSGGFGYEQPVKGTLLVNERCFGDDSAPLGWARGCIPDFPLFSGPGASTTIQTGYTHNPRGYASRLAGHIVLEADDWQITITQTNETGDLGHTHDVSISKRDRSEFTGTDLSGLITKFSYFLTFIAGVNRSLNVAVGYRDAFPVWGQFDRFKQNPYNEDNWFGRWEGGSMATLFPLFWNRLSSAGEQLTRPIELYAESSEIAHTGLHQHALTVSQSALEHIAESQIGPKPYGGETATHINNALSQIDIDTNLAKYPDICGAWRTKFQGSQTDNGPTFVTRLRNSVHPRPSNSLADGFDFYNAWRLSQYYVETALLKLCGYTGSYRNRMTSRHTMDSEPVPWALEQTGDTTTD